jgi:2,5-dihydroxypyridine 5,6-dioxygenase
MAQSFAPPERLEKGSDACVRGAAALVERCAGVRPGERVAIVSDPQACAAADHVFVATRALSRAVRFDVIEGLRIHGAPPPPHVAQSFAWADVIFCMTRMSMAHTAERKQATDRGARFLSLPDYDLGQLGSRSLMFDFASAVPVADRLKRLLDRAGSVRIVSPSGTELTFSTAGRVANACPGTCNSAGALASPPDAEVNIAPIEGTAEGTVVVDGSIPCPQIGRLKQPVTLSIRRGAIAAISGGAEATALTQLFEEVGLPAARVLAEFGIGLNPLAQLSGRMLEDEGCAQTIHFGFGSNATIGGCNRVSFHLDFVVCRPTVWLDGVLVIDRGVVGHD